MTERNIRGGDDGKGGKPDDHAEEDGRGGGQEGKLRGQLSRQTFEQTRGETSEQPAVMEKRRQRENRGARHRIVLSGAK